MNDFMLGVIGAGNMGSAILRGALASGVMLPGRCWLSNPTSGKLAPFGDMGVRTTNSNSELVNQVDIVLLAVKPQRLSAVLDEVGEALAGKCVVSIAAGISRSWLARRLPGSHVICAMPNTPLMVGKGATALTERGDVPEELYGCVRRIFAAGGLVEVLPEDRMNQVIPVSGSSPAFFFRMARLMAEEARRAGLDPEAALRLFAATMEGSARLLLESGKSPETLEKQVCSPGGTTLAALSAFDELGYEEMLAEAFARCVRRAEELGR